MTVARRIRLVALAALVTVGLLATGACTSPGHCSGSQGAPDGTVVTFVGTVEAVGDDGAVRLAVESVSPRDTTPRTDPTVFGVPHPTLPPVLDTVVVGSTVTVAFPAEQVEHLRRDLGRRYRVVTSADATSGVLVSELNDIERPCGRTRLADE